MTRRPSRAVATGAAGVGGLLTVFGLRGAGEKVDAWAVELVERSLAVPFL
jgi:hypothetical protein